MCAKILEAANKEQFNITKITLQRHQISDGLLSANVLCDIC